MVLNVMCCYTKVHRDSNNNTNDSYKCTQSVYHRTDHKHSVLFLLYKKKFPPIKAHWLTSSHAQLQAFWLHLQIFKRRATLSVWVWVGYSNVGVGKLHRWRLQLLHWCYAFTTSSSHCIYFSILSGSNGIQLNMPSPFVSKVGPLCNPTA